MTMMNLTVGADVAMLATDSLALGRDRSAIVEKAVAFPDLHMVMASRGVYGLTCLWADMIPHLGAEDVGQVAAAAPEWLLAASKATRCEEAEIVHVGWSKKDGAPAAFLCRSANGFRPERLTAGTGSLISPAPVMNNSDWPGIRALGAAALEGGEVERFHIALAQHQLAADRAGVYGDMPTLGGPLRLWKIDRQGISSSCVAIEGVRSAA